MMLLLLSETLSHEMRCGLAPPLLDDISEVATSLPRTGDVAHFRLNGGWGPQRSQPLASSNPTLCPLREAPTCHPSRELGKGFSFRAACTAVLSPALRGGEGCRECNACSALTANRWNQSKTGTAHDSAH